MQFLIDLGVRIDNLCSCDNDSQTSLAHAFRSGKIEAVQFLLSQGADPDVQDKLGDTLLCDAAVSGDEDIVNELLRRGVRVNITGSSGFTPLHYAAKGGSVNIVRALINAGAYLNAQDSGLNSPLAYAIMHDFNEAALHLLRCGADPNLKDRNAEVALFHATRKSNVQMVVALLEHGADPNSLNKEHESPLFFAAGQTDTGILKCLRRFKADPRIDKYAEPLRYRDKVVSVPLKDLEARNTANCFGDTTLLFYAAGDGNDSMVELLLDYKAQVDPQDQFGEKPICGAAGKGYEAIVKILLDKGANPNQPDSPSQSPIFWALKLHEESLSQKISRGRGSGSWPNFGVGDMSAVVEVLLQRGADPNIVDGKGRPLISLLIDREVNSRNIVESLLGAGCNPNVKDRYGRTPLMGAVVRDMLEFASALLEDPSLDREATDSFGRTAIKEAISRDKPCFLLLLDPQRYRSMVRVNGKEIPSDGKLVIFQQREENSLYNTPRWTVDIHTELSFEDPWCSGIRDAFIMMVDNSDRGVCCDVCGARTPREAALNCTICNDGDFDLCVECKKWGAACFDDEHELVNRQPLQNRGQYFLMGSSLHDYD